MSNYKKHNVMNDEEKFLAWAGYMNQQGTWGSAYDSDEVIDFEKHYNANLSNTLNEERFKRWVANDYSL